MFSVGDIVVYGQTGVCKVIEISDKEIIKNQKRLYYVLKSVYQNNTIYAPVVGGKVFMRHIISAQEAEELIMRIPEISSAITVGSDTEDYKTKICTHNIEELVAITAKIYKKKKIATANKRKLGFSDEKYMSIAEHLLFGELAAALGIDYGEVSNYIACRTKQE